MCLLKTIGGKDITTSNNCAKGATNATGYSDVALRTHTTTTTCDRIIVEVICHNDKPYTSDKSYTAKWGDYCGHKGTYIGPPGRIFPGDIQIALLNDIQTRNLNYLLHAKISPLIHEIFITCTTLTEFIIWMWSASRFHILL